MIATLFAEARAIKKIVLQSARSGMALSVLLADGAQKKFFHAGGAGGLHGVVKVAEEEGKTAGVLTDNAHLQGRPSGGLERGDALNK